MTSAKWRPNFEKAARGDEDLVLSRRPATISSAIAGTTAAGATRRGGPGVDAGQHERDDEALEQRHVGHDVRCRAVVAASEGHLAGPRRLPDRADAP
jgi:hypothetical protein